MGALGLAEPEDCFIRAQREAFHHRFFVLLPTIAFSRGFHHASSKKSGANT
jgi:hypothetical protein